MKTHVPGLPVNKDANFGAKKSSELVFSRFKLRIHVIFFSLQAKA